MKKIAIIAMGVFAMGAVSQSHAADIGVGVKGGMLGLGAELTVGLTDTLNGRLGYNTYTFKTTATESDIAYDIDLKWQSTPLLLDWHPGGGGFRLTLGYIINGNELDMKAQSTTGLQIGDGTYDVILRNKISFDNAPYVGLGWGNAAKRKGFGFSFEAGAMYQGAPKVSLSCTGASCAGAEDDIAKEEQNLKNDLDSYKWYPQLAFGVSYAF